MPLIRIQERLGGPDGPNAIVSFNNGPEYPITINDPFEEPQEQELECHFALPRYPTTHHPKHKVMPA